MAQNLTEDARNSSDNCLDVIIIGAGASGLMAARVLLHQQQKVVLLEARNRKGGRAFSYSLQGRGNNVFCDLVNSPVPVGSDSNMRVDLGCSSIHGVQDEGNSLWNLALHHRIKIPTVLQGVVSATTNYENTFVAPWFHNGTRISQYDITLLHRVHDAIVTRVSAYVQRRKKSVLNDSLLQIYETYQDEILDTFNIRLNRVQHKILQKIRNRYYGYCAPLQKQSPQDMRYLSGHFDDITHFDIANIKKDAVPIDKFIAAGKTHEIVSLNRRYVDNNWGSDVAPVLGYGSLVSDVLGQNIDVQYGKVVRYVTSVGGPENSTVLVQCEDGTRFRANKVICTVPLGVLKRNHGKSSITFSPPLSTGKQNLINSMSVGLHNKVIIKFAAKDVFWPPNLLQFNCLHPFIQFNNLHAIGKTGILLVHIFGSHEQYSDISSKSDEEVLRYVLTVLEKALIDEEGFGSTCIGRTVFDQKENKNDILSAFKGMRLESEVKPGTIPTPEAFLVTRWENDPFSCGSYTYCPLGSDMDSFANWLIPEQLGTGNDVLYFAGEHTVDGGEGWQCAHGAANSGIHAAYQILTGDTREKPIAELFQHITYLPTLPIRTTAETKVLESEVLELKKKIRELDKANDNLKLEVSSLRETETQYRELKSMFTALSKRMDSVESKMEGTRSEIKTSEITARDENLSTSTATPTVKVLLTHPSETSWKLIQAPIINGVRKRLLCLHPAQDGSKHQTFNVCTRCRRYVCKNHWELHTDSASQICKKYDENKNEEKTKMKGGRPAGIYKGPIQ